MSEVAPNSVRDSAELDEAARRLEETQEDEKITDYPVGADEQGGAPGHTLSSPGAPSEPRTLERDPNAPEEEPDEVPFE